MNKNTAGPAEPIYDSRNFDEPPRMRIRCENHDYYLKPDGCPMCRALKAEAELESLRQENARLREALEKIAEPLTPNDSDDTYTYGIIHGLSAAANKARQALNPPKRS